MFLSNHGTGHGVGSYLSVHETQIGLSASSLAYFSEFFPSFRRIMIDSLLIKLDTLDTPLAIGHVTSNEPAYYETGSYGIRLESVLGVKEIRTRRQFGDRKWLGFERFTTVSTSSDVLSGPGSRSLSSRIRVERRFRSNLDLSTFPCSRKRSGLGCPSITRPARRSSSLLFLMMY